jgi:hypothetical protein
MFSSSFKRKKTENREELQRRTREEELQRRTREEELQRRTREEELQRRTREEELQHIMAQVEFITIITITNYHILKKMHDTTHHKNPLPYNDDFFVPEINKFFQFKNAGGNGKQKTKGGNAKVKTTGGNGKVKNTGGNGKQKTK